MLALTQMTANQVTLVECVKTCTYQEFDAHMGPSLHQTLDKAAKIAERFGTGEYSAAVQNAAEETNKLVFDSVNICITKALKSFSNSAESAETVVSAALGTCGQVRTAAYRSWTLLLRSRTTAGVYQQVKPRVQFPLESEGFRQAYLAKVLQFRAK